MLMRTRDSHFRSAAKALSWRMIGTLDTLILSFIVTGNFKIAGTIASTEMLTKMFLYYLHERAWSQVGKVPTAQA
jgi:uncharacterized membrane protein